MGPGAVLSDCLRNCEAVAAIACVSPMRCSNWWRGNGPATPELAWGSGEDPRGAQEVQDLRPGGWYTPRRPPQLQHGPPGGPSRPGVPPMSEVTRILSAIEQGDPHAAVQLLPLVYDELRKLAASKLAQENPGQTLQATALVHEAYLRL